MSEGRTPAAAVAPPDHGVSDYMVDMFNITVGRQIGVGTSKSVFEGTRSNGEKIAVLRVRQEHATRRGLPREAAAFILAGQHPHLVSFLGVGFDDGSGTSVLESAASATAFVMPVSSGSVSAMPCSRYTVLTELAPLGSLDGLLERRGRDELPLTCAVEILQQVASAVRHLTAAGLVHGDLSLRNILVFQYPSESNTDVTVKLTDLAGAINTRRSVAPVAPNSLPVKRVLNATVAVRYAPPEVLDGRLFSELSDVWSLAVCAWELFSDDAMPYLRLDSDEEVSRSVCAGLRLERPQRCPPALWATLESCWATKPDARPRLWQLEQQLAVVHALVTLRPEVNTLPAGATPADVVRRVNELSGTAAAPRGSAAARRHHEENGVPAAELLMIAIESLEPSSTLPEGVSDEMRLEHHRSRYQMAEQAARVPLHVHAPVARAGGTAAVPLASSRVPPVAPSASSPPPAPETPQDDFAAALQQSLLNDGPNAEARATTADESEEELKFATALSISDQTAHLPRIHAFLTSQAQWVEPTSSFLHMAMHSERPGGFAAFHALVEELLVKHLLDVVPTPHPGEDLRGALTLAGFAQFCVLCSPGGLLDDLAWVDAAVLEQVRLITLVESQERFEALLREYAGLVTEDGAAEAEMEPSSRWDRYFEVDKRVGSASPPGASPPAAASSAAPSGPAHVALDMRTQGFAQLQQSSVDDGDDEVEVVVVRRASARIEEPQSLAAALKSARKLNSR